MEIEIIRIWHAVRKYWLLGVGAMVAFALIAALISSLMSTQYSARTTLLVVPPELSSVTLVEGGGSAQTYVALVESGPVLDRVNLELNLGLDRVDLAEKVTVAILPGTQIIEIIVTDDDPERAADITNSIARAFVAQVDNLTTGNLQDSLDTLLFESSSLGDQIASIDQQLSEFEGDRSELATEERIRFDELTAERLYLAQTQADVDSAVRNVRSQLAVAQPVVAVNETAHAPGSPDNPSTLLLSIVGAAVGAIIGALLMLLLEFRRTGVRDATHAEHLISAPVLAEISGRAEEPDGHRLDAALARISGRARNLSVSNVALVSPTRNASNTTVLAEITTRLDAVGIRSSDVSKSESWSTIINSLSEGDAAVFVVSEDRTKAKDVTDSVSLLQDMNVPVLGTILIRS